MPRFFIKQPLNSNLAVELTAPILEHIHALRLKNNDIIELFNGNGHSYLAKLLKLDKKLAQALIIEQLKNNEPPKLNIELAISIIANDKMELIIQKATELGITQITPIISERTQQNGAERLEKKSLRWQNILISSCEQCGQNTMPKLNNAITLENFITNPTSQSKPDHINIILSPYKYSSVSNLYNKYKSATLLVGPEGGFSNQEMHKAVTNNFIPITLGNLVMRAETATITGIAALYTRFGDWIKESS